MSWVNHFINNGSLVKKEISEKCQLCFSRCLIFIVNQPLVFPCVSKEEKKKLSYKTFKVKHCPQPLEYLKYPCIIHPLVTHSLIINSTKGQLCGGRTGIMANIWMGWWMVGRAPGEMYIETHRERDLQVNVHKQTDCQKRAGLRQRGGQINRHTDSAKAKKQRQTML